MSIYRVGIQPVGTKFQPSTYTQPTPDIFTRWLIKIFHRSGGLKKEIDVGQEQTNFISAEYERNQKGCGSGALNFAQINFPIHADDKVEIYFKGVKDYTGYVEKKPDPKGGEIRLIPLWQRTEERLLLASKTYTTKTILEILTDLFTVQCTDSGISWNASLVDTGSSATYTITFAYTPLSDIIKWCMGKLSADRYWGVNENNFFFVTQQETSVSVVLDYNETPAYQDISTEIDTSGIKATRYQVYIKNTGASGSTRAGQVGYGSGYDPLPIENLIRIKEDTITVPDEIGAGGETSAKDYAYALLQSYVAYQPITLNKVLLDRYHPEIGEMVTVQDREAEQLVSLIDCETATGWTNATLDTTIYCEGSASVKFTAAAIGDYIEYAYLHQIYLHKPQYLVFMVRSSAASGLFLTVKIYSGYSDPVGGWGIGTWGMGPWGIGDGTGEDNTEDVVINNLNISAVAEWFSFPFPLTKPITRIRFEVTETPGSSTQINVDQIEVFQTYAPTHTKNVVQYNVKFSPGAEDVTAKLNTYDRAANYELQKFNDQIAAIEKVIIN